MSGRYEKLFAWDDPVANPNGVTAQAIQLHKEGLSCSLIGERLGTSRNSVIGKLNRLGFTRPHAATGEKRKPTKARLTGWQQRAKAAQKAKPKPAPKPTDGIWAQPGEIEPAPRDGEAIEVPLAQRKQVADLEPGDCRFPYGDLAADRASFYLCGGKVVPGLSYCEAHARCCYQPPNPKRRPVDLHRTGFSLPPQRPRIEHEEAADGPSPLNFEDA
jgi:hypothetical protein